MPDALAPHVLEILDRLAEAVTVQDAAGRLVYANHRAAALLGFASQDDLLAADPATIVAAYEMRDEHGRPLDVGRLPGRRALAGEELPEPLLVEHVVRRSGERRWALVKAASIHDGDGEVAFAVSISEDVTKLIRTEREQRLLARASKLLSSSLDPAQTIEKIAWALVPDIAERATVHLADERGDLVVAATARVGDAPLAEAAAWPRPDAVYRMARAELHPTAGEVSAMAVPIAAGDRVLGVLALAADAERRRFDERDLALAEEVGHRSGVALDHARQHEGRTRIATTLQRSLLPPRLPTIPGVTLAARFRAAEEASEVGGDFYEVFAVGGGWMVLIGDVTGKGPEAAALTGLARHTMRTASLYDPRPAAVLHRLNETLLGEGERGLCSAICAMLRPGTGRLAVTLARAGHPPPYLLRAAGTVEPVGVPGTLAGAFTDGRWPETEAELGDGETLVVYTDGVTDAGAGVERFGDDRLEAVLGRVAGRPADEVVEAIEGAVLAFQRGPQRDDVAILAIGA